MTPPIPENQNNETPSQGSGPLNFAPIDTSSLSSDSTSPKPQPVLTRRDPNPDSSYRFTDQRIIQHLEVAIGASSGIEALLSNVSRIVSAQCDCLALWVCQKNEVGDYGSPYLLTEEGETIWVVVEDQAKAMLKRVARTRQICSSPLRSSPNSELVVGPIILGHKQETPIQMMMIGCFSSEEQSVLRQQWLIGMVSQAIARWHQSQSLNSLETKTESLNDSIGLVHAIDKTETISEASMVIVNNLRRLCNAEQVSIVLTDLKNKPRLQAVSDVEKIDRNAESNKVISNACNQAILSNATLHYPAPEGEHSPAMLALEKYCKSNNIDACVGLPLQSEEGQTYGAILLGLDDLEKRPPQFIEYVNRIVALTSGHLAVVLRANQGLRDITKRRWQSFRKAWLTKIVAGVAAALLALMFVPWPYRVACECEIQPVLRRFIASPHDGILEKTFVESGAIVEPNQVVAHLDGSQLRIELSGLSAEFDGAKKRRDSALAQGEIASSQIARSEMKRHQAKIEILEAQLQNLEVRSPIAGIVVSGDLEKVEGAPVEMGKTLFEIAPLDNMLAEIGIPEAEIPYAKPGMEVSIKLNAFPFKTWTGKVEKIHPRSELMEDESVFIAQVRLANMEDQLRPGMKGTAKIRTHYSPIGWNLFHHSWETIRYWTIW